MKLYTLKGDLAASKILATAKLCDTPLALELLKPNFHIEKRFKDMFTFKSLPILEIQAGQTLLKANAIVRYIASNSSNSNTIYGSTEMEKAKVDAMLDFLGTELEPSIL